MKKHIAIVIVAVTIIVGLAAWLWFGHHRVTETAPIPAQEPGALAKPAETLPRAYVSKNDGTIPPKPRLFKSKEYPPKSPDVQAMWDWWLAMDKADHSFQWKMPIEFYGIVLDQFDQPVAGADVSMTWTTDGGTRTNKIKSGEDGKFSLSDASGKRLSVSVLKLGYARTTSWTQSFDYSSFSDDTFHVPDSANPVVFKVQKLIKPEPLFVYTLSGTMKCDGTLAAVDIEKGKVGEVGDFQFAVTTSGNSPVLGSDYTVSLNAKPGAGFVVEPGEFAIAAPQQGYQSAITFRQSSTDSTHKRKHVIRFYGKTTAGTYARLIVRVEIDESGTLAYYTVGIFYNPSGSRNLEFDDRLRLNRWD